LRVPLLKGANTKTHFIRLTGIHCSSVHARYF